MRKKKEETITKEVTGTTQEPKRRKKEEIEYPSGIKGLPDTVRKLWKRAMDGNSRKTAIRAQCLICCGGSPSEVKNCSMHTCTLHKYRITG